MSSVVDSIVNVFNTIAAVVITTSMPWLAVILVSVSPEFKNWYVESLAPIMALLGIAPEDVIQAQVVDQRLMGDEDVKNLMTKIALDHQKTQRGIIELMAAYSMRTKGSLDKYFAYGKNDFYNGLPTTNVRGQSIPAAVYTQIGLEYGTPVNMISETIKVPTKEEYLYWKMNKLYGYQTWTNTLVYTGLVYTVKYMDYNFTTNDYDITMYRAATQTTDVTVTITPFDATQDNKNTTTVVTVTTYEGIVSTNTTSVDVLIPKATEVNSFTSTSISIEYGTIVVAVPGYPPMQNYVIQWYATNNGHIMYWCYELGSGNVALDNSMRYVSELEMLPIVEIRNNKINTNSNPLSVEYLDSKDMLDFIGLDIDMLTTSINENPDIANITNSYVYFGVDLKDTNPTIAKLLYNTFEFLYTQNIVDTETSTYTAYTTEGNFNSTMSWRQQTRTIVNGILGPINTYTSHTVGATLVLRRQANPEQYIEYQIVDIAATTFIKEGAFYAAVAKQLQDGGVILPLSRFMVDQMTPIEQIEVFGRSLRLQCYSATVIHLEWYETSAFYNLIQVVVIVMSIVLAVLSAPVGGSAGQWFYWVAQMALVMAASYAFTLLLESTDNPWLKALYIAAAVAALAAGTQMDPSAIGFWTADQITTAVTQYTEYLMEGLEEAALAFQEMAADKMEELTERANALAGYLDTGFVAELARSDMQQPFVLGYDAMMYQAVGRSKDSITEIKSAYNNIYQYDKYYVIGVQNY